MGLLGPGISEVIATTRLNAAPIGIHCRGDSLSAVLFKGSHTAENVTRDGWLVANVVLDPLLFLVLLGIFIPHSLRRPACLLVRSDPRSRVGPALRDGRVCCLFGRGGARDPRGAHGTPLGRPRGGTGPAVSPAQPGSMRCHRGDRPRDPVPAKPRSRALPPDPAPCLGGAAMRWARRARGAPAPRAAPAGRPRPGFGIIARFLEKYPLFFDFLGLRRAGKYRNPH